MRGVEVGAVLLAAVAGAVGVAGCGQTCNEVTTLVDDTKEVSPSAACAFSALRERTQAFEQSYTTDCADVCGKSVYNTCYITDPTYGSEYAFANSGRLSQNPSGLFGDGGAAPTIPPVCPEHAGTVKVRCAVAEDREVSTLSGCVVSGRRPEGLLDEAISGEHSALGAYFARAAHLEAAAVVAFEELAQDLWLLGAPTRLVARCHAAAREEVRHASLVGALARRFGAGVPAVRRVAPPNRGEARARVALALENMVEGVVRETYAAAVELHRARVVEDPEVRAALAVVSRDEASHAQLSWDIARWLDEALDPSQRAAVAAAAARAVEELRDELRAPAPEVTRVAGAPSVEAAFALFGALEKDLWRELTVAA
ncbi:MAG: ferritin-like domain-containing protein [Polyangiaceae bacterium]|nr:ferritin-like domain-containing protein [Polyangiaceae bacterium]